jgi:hypothetical protein
MQNLHTVKCLAIEQVVKLPRAKPANQIYGVIKKLILNKNLKNNKMKKIIGIIGVCVFALTMFMNTNSANNTNSDTNLASLMSISSANAEQTEAKLTYCQWFGDRTGCKDAAGKTCKSDLWCD